MSIGRIDLLLSLNQVVLMKGNGFITIGMVMGSKLSVMVVFIRDSLRIINLKAREDSSIMMVTLFKVSGKKIKLMDSGFILIKMELFMKVTGKIINRMGKG